MLGHQQIECLKCPRKLYFCQSRVTFQLQYVLVDHVLYSNTVITISIPSPGDHLRADGRYWLLQAGGGSGDQCGGVCLQWNGKLLALALINGPPLGLGIRSFAQNRSD